MSSEQEWPPLPPLSTSLRGRCPRCGQGHLFSGLLKLRSHCEVRGLDSSYADPADGPTFFVICCVCIPTIILALWIEAKFEPPYWVRLVTTLPFLLLTCIPPLRPLKGWLVASQYFYKAEEVRFGTAEPTELPVAPPVDRAYGQRLALDLSNVRII